MAFTINGIDLISAKLTEPRTGAWTAEVEADTDKPITGLVTLDVEGERFVGTVYQGDVESSRWKGLIIGGRGGTQKVVQGNFYERPTAGVVLQDLARESGEVLSPDIAPILLMRSLERWTRIEDFAHVQYRQLADELGCDWRITRAGELWMGSETWPEVKAKCIEVDYAPERCMIEIAYEDGTKDRPVLRPGVTFEGDKIQRVLTRVDGDGLRQALFFDEEKGDTGLRATVVRFIKEVVWPKLTLARVYPARVCGQAPDGNVTIALDDRTIGGRSKGLSRLPLLLGLPGTRVKTTNATRLRLLWDEGRPTKPRAGHFDQGTPALELSFTVSELFSVSGKVALGAPDATAEVALAPKIHQSISAMLAAGSSGPGAPNFAAAKAAWEAGTLGIPIPPGIPEPPVMPMPVGATKVKAI